MKNGGNKNFILLLQGQLVSTLGDALYAIALSFWVLNLTGSTAMVGTMMGIITIPRVILGPLAGTYVDRHSRKNIIVYTDLIRGITILLIAILAHCNVLPIWCLFLVAVIDGTCASFFNPSMEAFLPEVVAEEKLVKSRSLFEMMKMGADVLGQTIGGVLYSLLGAPMMFFLNGVSYLFSSGTELFIPEERKNKKQKKTDYFSDMKEGFRYIWVYRGLFLLILMSFLFNFLFGMIRVLIVPWFVTTEGFGEAKYGFFNGACSVGMVVGMMLLSFVQIKEMYKHKVYAASLMLFVLLVHAAAWTNSFFVVLGGFALAFACMAVFNTLLSTTVILRTSENMRGKVSATKLTLCMAASPLGNFAGGILGEWMDARIAIILISAVAMVIILPFILSKEVSEYMSK